MLPDEEDLRPWPKTCNCDPYSLPPHWHWPEWMNLHGDRSVFMMLERWWPDRRPIRST